MSKPMVRIHNVETDEIIDREMTDAEFEQWQTQVAEQEAEQEAKIGAEAEALASKQALLDRLGITAEEAQLLIS